MPNKEIEATAPLAASVARVMSRNQSTSGEYLVAFSGGADSAALLHYLVHATPKAKIYAVHVNHGIRGDEAQRDEDFCRRQCEKYGVKLFVCHYDVPTLAKQQKLGIEETARNARKEAFATISSQQNNPRLVTAHTADDNLETMVFNLTRGTGLRGMCGIVPSVHRPLIFVSRQEILDYCSAHGVEYIHDSTNDSTDYTRNYIRHNIIPHLRHINPAVHRAASRLSENLWTDEEYLEWQTTQIFAPFVHQGKLEVPALQNIHETILVRVLKKAHQMAVSQIHDGKEQGQLTSDNIKQLLEIIRVGKPTQLSLPGKVRGKIEDGGFGFVRDDRKR
ncbi:MAG: tRNA lysidine(34) synthetase TilS [Oscillospiraceae bacterium]|nr:tRNA lysidine(34) synthetase TilS [Oscillospiraceae bacterium]